MSGNIDDQVRIRLAEMMSSAGLGYNSISLEILYMLPREFVNRYQELWEASMGPVVRAPGDGMARDGELGKAPTSTKDKGRKIGAGAGGASKRFQRIFTVRSDPAFRLKDRVDKRLRGIARDIRDELGLIEDSKGKGGETTAGKDMGLGVRQCKKCGRVMASGWKYCPNDGSQINEMDEGNDD